MSHCRICRHTASTIALAANDDRLSPINLPTIDEISQPSCVRRLAMVYRAKGLARRNVIDFVADHLFLYEGSVVHEGRNVFFYDDLDEIFGAESDPSQRWMGDFLAFAVEPPRQKAQRRIAERLLLLWAALAVHNREQAAHVLR